MTSHLLRGDPVSTIRTAADTIRTLVGALPERARSEWACDLGIVWAPRGTPIVQARAWRDDADRHAIGALIATVASPDVAAALADLLDALAWWRQAITSGDDMSVALAVNRVHATGDSLADAITRKHTPTPAARATTRARRTR